MNTYYLYWYGHLIEINSHSLFSKWFSEMVKTALSSWREERMLQEAQQNMTSQVCFIRFYCLYLLFPLTFLLLLPMTDLCL